MKSALLIAAFILLIRVPFLNQAVQGDDVYYLASATHAQIDPAHPNHVHYIFEGRDVDFRGYPHPPLNAWCLAALIAIFGAVKEIPFHAAYIGFSLFAAAAMMSLSRRFSPHPLWATLLFLSTPVFVINGSSFESDIPFVAFWLAGVAAFVKGSDGDSRLWLGTAGIALGLAALTSPQALFAVPVLAFYDRRRWLTIASPILAFVGWQLFEYVTGGQIPFLVAAGYVQSYGLERLAAKLRIATALTVHLFYLIWPILLGAGIIFRRNDKPRSESWFLVAWIVLFFLCSVAVFPAGSARYLLPLAAPAALLISRLPTVFLKTGFAVQLTLSLLLATVNYQHWDANRQFARSLAGEAERHRVWVNAEWSLRFYFEELGGRPVLENQQIPPGDLLVSSALAYPVPLLHGGSSPVLLRSQEIRPRVPLRTVGLETGSAYSSMERGFYPFGISAGVIDRLRAEVLVRKQATTSYVDFADSHADDQIAAGIYAADGNPWRWMAKSATVILKAPPTPTPVEVHLYIPNAAKARSVMLTIDGTIVASQTYAAPGTYTIRTAPQTGTVLTIEVDKSFTVPTDHRELGIILTGAGYKM